MEYEDDSEAVGEVISDEKQINDEVEKAEQFLKQQGDFGTSLWDLLCSLVNKLLTERPNDAYETLENIVRSIKQDNTSEEHPVIVPLTDTQLQHAQLMKELLTLNPSDAEWFAKTPQSPPWSEVIEQMTLLNRLAGIVMPEETILQLSFSIRRFLQVQPEIKRARFWGCVAERYYVLETELTEAGYTKRREMQDAAEREAAAAQEAQRKAEEERAKEEEGAVRPPQQKIDLQPPPVPSEPPGSGVNRMVYWVSLELGCPESWISLPDVTPLQISIARRIICLFSGQLDAKVNCWPPFPGDEKSMLRAQIARISAGTLVAPAGFFRARPRRDDDDVESDEDSDEEDEEDSEDEDGETEREAVSNSKYRPPSAPGTLLQPSSWVHYRPHILQQQARIKWWNPNPDASDEEDEDEEEDDTKAADKGPERGPKLMSLLSNDRSEPALTPGIPDCWAFRDLGAGATLASSLLWQGAFTLTAGRHLEHVYVGWGWKTSCENWSPAPPPPSAPEPPELHCVNDPTPAEEAAAQPELSDEEEDEEDEESD